MSYSRRGFVKTLGAGSVGMVTASMAAGRGHESLAGLWASGFEEELFAAETSDILLNSNENPLGPGEPVLQAIRQAIGATGASTGRYPFTRSRVLAEAIAKKFGVSVDNVIVGCGSTQLLRTCTQVFTSPTRALVAPLPTFEECASYAGVIGHPVKPVALDKNLRIDIEPTISAATGAGLVFFCNPNNPTATVHAPSDTNDFITRLHQASPETYILVDEAYIDYVTAPGHRSEIARAVADPRVVVSRTFSKAYGMAGLRVGYAIAHKDTIKKLAEWEESLTVSYLSMEAALQAIQQDEQVIAVERARNTIARDFTREFFAARGCRDTESQANFVFVEIGMPIQDFSNACRAMGVRVARPFPPMLTHARVTVGTMDEMKKATGIFAKVLDAARARAA